MLTDPEIMNNALKQALYREEMTAKKYADLSKQMTDPELQTLLKGMEMAARMNYSMLSKKITDMAMV